MAEKLVEFDLTRAKAVILSALPTQADRTRILRGLGAAAVATWKRIAMEKLHATSRDYVNGIQGPDMDDNVVRVSLEGQVPNMVEQGWKGGDERQWLLSSPKAKQGKNGPYLVVPFRHGTPGSGGRNVGTPMPPEIHEVAKKLAPTISRLGKPVGGSGTSTTIWGERLHPGLPMKEQARKILMTKAQPWHTTSPHMGMVRKAQPTRSGKMQTSGYITFRTISRHSNQEGKHWVHPGITARNLVLEVQRQVESIADKIIAATQSGSSGPRNT